jgi:hypothetical protein
VSAPLATGPSGDGFVVIQRYPQTSVATGEVRLAISIADTTATLQRTGPERLVGEIRNEEGNLVQQFDVPRRGTGLDVAYWSIEATIPARGLYELVVEGATGEPTPFLVFDPSEIAIPCAGEALPAFDKQIRGFAMHDAVLTGVETRTSSPVRIRRGDNFQSINTVGLYPAGEGAGYAGGIMSAAIDGSRIAEAVALSICARHK